MHPNPTYCRPSFRFGLLYPSALTLTLNCHVAHSLLRRFPVAKISTCRSCSVRYRRKHFTGPMVWYGTLVVENRRDGSLFGTAYFLKADITT
jgi:hypothetical protein